jgi:RecG-like helicase
MSETMAPPRDEGTETDPAPPTAFATDSAQDRDELRAADLRSAPRPSLLAVSVQTLKGAGPKMAAAAADMGLGSVGDVLLHVPHSYRDRAEPRKLAELRIGEEATVEVDVRSARVRPTRRRGLVIVEATVADDSGPRRPSGSTRHGSSIASRRGRGCSCSASSTAPDFAWRPTRCSARGAPGAGIHTTGIVPVHPASERLRAQRLREWAWQARRSPGVRSSRFRPSSAPAAALRRRRTR